MWDVAGDLGYPVINLPAGTTSPDAVVRFLVGHLVEGGSLAAEHAARVIDQILRRESLGSTAIGGGVAVPHSKSEFVFQVLGLIGRTAEPVKWPGAVDGVPVRLACLLVTPATDPGASLRALEAVVRRLRRSSGGGSGARV